MSIRINLKKIKQHIKRYNDLINEYEYNYLNYYNIISSISFLWNDENSKKFLLSVSNEKKYCKELLSELNLTNDVYKYIYTKYSKFGEEIYINIEKINTIINKFDKCIEQATQIFNIYKNLNYSKKYSLFILEQTKRIENIIIELKNSKEQLKKHVNEIEQIERNIKNRLNKINISIIKETDISSLR